MQSLEDRIAETRRLLYPVSDLERVVAGNEPPIVRQLSVQRLNHVYDGMRPVWTLGDLAGGALMLIGFFVVVLGLMYLLTPYIVAVME